MQGLGGPDRPFAIVAVGDGHTEDREQAIAAAFDPPAEGFDDAAGPVVKMPDQQMGFLRVRISRRTGQAGQFGNEQGRLPQFGPDGRIRLAHVLPHRENGFFEAFFVKNILLGRVRFSRRHGGGCAGRGGAAPAALFQDLAMKGFGFRFGGDIQFLRQHRAEFPVLLKRQRRVPGPGIKRHDRPARRFAQGIERHQPQSQRQRRIVPAGGPVMVDQAFMGIERLFAQMLALGQQPAVEGRGLDIQPVQQLAGIEIDRPLQPFGPALGQCLFETGDIDRARRRMESDGVGFRLKAGAERGGGPAQDGQGLAQTGARLFVPDILPQQGGKLGPAVACIRPQGEISQKRARLLGRYPQGFPARSDQGEAAKQRQSEGRHPASRKHRQPHRMIIKAALSMCPFDKGREPEMNRNAVPDLPSSIIGRTYKNPNPPLPL
jgi:hypothetical protein